MKKTSLLPRNQALETLSQSISLTTKIRKEKHGMTSMQARESIIEQLGWLDGGYGYSKWRRHELELVDAHEKCPRRRACIIKNEQPDDAPVYIFKLDIEIVCTDEEGDEWSISDAMDTIEFDFGAEFKTAIKIQEPIPHCSKWIPEGPFEVRKELEWRIADCSCRRNYLFQMRNSFKEFNESYFLENKEDLIKWSTKWGGVACFEESVLEMLDSTDSFRSQLMRPYLA